MNKELLELCTKKINKEIDISWDLLARQYGYNSGEQLRQHFKLWRRKNGVLPSRQQIVEVEVENKLNTARQMIGELEVLKGKISLEKRQLNKIKKDFIPSIAIVDEIKEYMDENNFTVNIPEYCKSNINIKKGNTMLVTIADWHIGYVINNCNGNSFNYAIANERIDTFIEKCYEMIKLYDISLIHLVNLGDTVEHTYMRKTQNQHCEFAQAEQINKAIELLYKLIVALNKHCYVIYDSIAGNHDRMSGDYKQSFQGDNVNVIISEQLKKYISLSGNNRANVVDRSHNENAIVKEINGVKCKFTHGNSSRYSKGREALRYDISMDNEFIDIIYKGHIHNFSCLSENHGRYIVTVGCLSGFNDYSLDFGCATKASQSITIIGEDSSIKGIFDVAL